MFWTDGLINYRILDFLKGQENTLSFWSSLQNVCATKRALNAQIGAWISIDISKWVYSSVSLHWRLGTQHPCLRTYRMQMENFKCSKNMIIGNFLQKFLETNRWKVWLTDRNSFLNKQVESVANRHDSPRPEYITHKIYFSNPQATIRKWEKDENPSV